MPIGSGLLINAGAYNCTINGNVVYKALQGAAFFDWLAGASVYGNTSANNTFYTNIVGGIPMLIASDDNHNNNVLSASNNNFLCNPYSTNTVQYLWTQAQTFTLQEWRTATNLDLASVASYSTWTPPSDLSFLVVNNTATAQTFTYKNVVDLNNQPVASLTVPPFSSRVLINTIVLPVKLIGFYGNVNGACNDLYWSTATELNSFNHILETSENGLKDWKEIGTRRAAGTTSLPQNYKMTDPKPLPQAYYRLRFVDFDGSSEFSNTIFLKRSKPNFAFANVSPNPSSEQVRLTYQLDKPQIVTFKVFNLLGIELESREVAAKEGINTAFFDLGNYPAATYIVSMENATERTVFKTVHID